jgi:peptidoglycan/LPS O-acetylase OafA/YrhL
MLGAHRRPDEDPVRPTLKSILWQLLLAGVIVAGLAFLAIVGMIVYLIATDSKYLPIATAAVQGIAAGVLARELVLKMLRNRTPSPIILADWIGDAAVVIAFVVCVLAGVGQYEGWMHGAFEYATSSILGLFVVVMPVYWWRGKRRVVLALTARAVDGRWPWSAEG